MLVGLYLVRHSGCREDNVANAAGTLRSTLGHGDPDSDSDTAEDNPEFTGTAQFNPDVNVMGRDAMEDKGAAGGPSLAGHDAMEDGERGAYAYIYVH